MSYWLQLAQSDYVQHADLYNTRVRSKGQRCLAFAVFIYLIALALGAEPSRGCVPRCGPRLPLPQQHLYEPALRIQQLQSQAIHQNLRINHHKQRYVDCCALIVDHGIVLCFLLAFYICFTARNDATASVKNGTEMTFTTNIISAVRQSTHNQSGREGESQPTTHTRTVLTRLVV